MTTPFHWDYLGIRGFKFHGVCVRTGLAWVENLEMVWKWVGASQNLVFE